MLDRSDKERLAALETDIPWIKETLGRLELGLKEVHKSVESHLTSPRHGNGGSGNGTRGISIQIGQKTSLAILGLFSGGGLAGVVGLLKLWEVLD